ncbi:MAG: gamma-glutamyltransferase family protein [Hydrogenophaga sp.]|nr:gamma-glutamyltransferase family protein [Hydrogenophaga sp.]
MNQSPLHAPPPARLLPALTVLTAALALAACGGSSDDPAPPPEQPVASSCEVNTGHGGIAVGSGVPGDPALPEPASPYRSGMLPVNAKTLMVVTANPLATKAGCDVLVAGGSAADAAVAVQMVLGLVEPQSSGIGGGAFAVHYDAATGTVQTYDGRETAPAAADENYLRWISPTDQTTPLPDRRRSGRSIGTPGTVRMLALLHADHGQRPWAGLFEPGIRHATEGFAISGRMAAAIAGASTDLLRDPDAVDYFLTPSGQPRPLGERIRNPDYADTLRRIADGGANAFYAGEIAADIVAEINRTQAGPAAPGPLTPGAATLADLAGYQALRRAPVCIDYRLHKVCGMGPPSSGGIAVAQTLGILENFDLSAHGPTAVDANGGKPSVMGVHLVSEAERLAYADRNRYVADTDFVPLPGDGVSSMLDKDYLRQRAELISPATSLGTATAGTFPSSVPMGSSAAEGNGTSHVSIVDAQGNAVALTTTIESGMGSFRFVRGFLLNNELTDFSVEPADGIVPIANRVQSGKRPRSSMAPTVVMRLNSDGSTGDLAMVTGSPGGAAIIQYVVKTLVASLDWGLNAQQAAGMVNFGSANGVTTNVGGEHPAISGATDPLVTGLQLLGHTVSVSGQASGVSTIRRLPDNAAYRWQGGADPRREGLVLGD